MHPSHMEPKKQIFPQCSVWTSFSERLGAWPKESWEQTTLVDPHRYIRLYAAVNYSRGIEGKAREIALSEPRGLWWRGSSLIHNPYFWGPFMWDHEKLSPDTAVTRWLHPQEALKWLSCPRSQNQQGSVLAAFTELIFYWGSTMCKALC